MSSATRAPEPPHRRHLANHRTDDAPPNHRTDDAPVHLEHTMNRPGSLTTHRTTHRTAAALTLSAALGLATACAPTQAATTAHAPTATATHAPLTTAHAPTATTTSTTTAPTTTTTAAAPLPRPDHVVVVVMENHSYADIIGNSEAPYINALAAQGASFTHSYAITHPSEPNYLALFSGSTAGLTDDSCPHTYSDPNLASELIATGLAFTGYSESMPQNGYTGCTAGEYARRHNPWVDFTNVPSADNRTFADFPSDYTQLPTVSFVIPNVIDDMHDGTIAQGDAWLRTNLNGYVEWVKTHNSELVITWDEDDSSSGNQIPTLIIGAHVRPGSYDEPITHYSVLRTLEDFYQLPAAGQSASAAPISDIFTG
jgi:acid phosphatase